MTHEDFDARLRQSLATLAREAVPDDRIAAEPPSDVPALQVEARRRPRRLLVALVAAVVLVGAVVAIATRGDKRSPRPAVPVPEWTKVARSPLTPRSSQVAVFTGHDVIVWGGRSDASTNIIPGSGPSTPHYTLADGAAYDVQADRWRPLPRAPIAGRYAAVAVWTGHEMLVVGGQRDHATPQGGIGFLRDGTAYDPARNSWRRIPDAPGCPRFGAWTGTQLVVGGYCADRPNGNKEFFAAYDPARDRWTRLPVFAAANQLVAAGGRLYAWDTGVAGKGAVFDSSTRRWRALPAVTDSDNALQDSVAIAYRDRLVVVGRVADPTGNGPDVARVAILGPGGWTSASSLVGPPLGEAVVASTDGAVVWSTAQALGAETIDRTMRGFSLVAVDSAPISLDRYGESLVGIGYRRFFVWGGRLAGTEKDPTNRPVADGAVVQLP